MRIGLWFEAGYTILEHVFEESEWLGEARAKMAGKGSRHRARLAARVRWFLVPEAPPLQYDDGDRRDQAADHGPQAHSHIDIVR